MPKQKIAIDVDDFIRTRNALTTSFISLSSSIDRAVKAYIEHTDLVANDPTISLNMSTLLEPFEALKAIAAPPPPVVETEAAPKKQKKAKAPRDPNAPRRPLTAYFRYLNEVRPRITAELQQNGTPHKPGDLSVIATERWKSLPREKHEPYHEAYRNEMVKYKAELAEYLARTGALAPETALVSRAPIAAADDDEDDEDDDDSDTDTDSDDEDQPRVAAPPPPPVVKSKKTSSPETVVKTPKSSKKSASANTSTPMFSSLASSSKKRKADEPAAEQQKKPRGRPPKSDKKSRVNGD